MRDRKERWSGEAIRKALAAGHSVPLGDALLDLCDARRERDEDAVGARRAHRERRMGGRAESVGHP